MITTKKTPLWGRIAVTLMALIMLVFACGYALSALWESVVFPGALCLFELIEGRALMDVMTDYFGWLCGISLDEAGGIPEMVLRVVLGLIPRVMGLTGHALMVLGAVLLPVNLWILSGKRVGNIVSALLMGVITAGFGLSLGQIAWVGVSSVLVNLFMHALGFSQVWSVLDDVLPMVFTTLMTAVLFITAFFGMRPKWISVPATVLAMGSVCLQAGGMVLGIAYLAVDMLVRQSYALPSLLIQWVGKIPYSLAAYSLFVAVLFVCLVYAAVARFPSLFGKKKA